MKTILHAVVFALSLTACLNQSAPGASGSGTAAVGSPESIGAQTSSQQSSPALLDETCYEACADAYEACLGNATDPGAECNCYNADVGCRRRCGDHDPFIRCWE